jgi:hypothetical protein
MCILAIACCLTGLRYKRQGNLDDPDTDEEIEAYETHLAIGANEMARRKTVKLYNKKGKKTVGYWQFHNADDSKKLEKEIYIKGDT